MQDAKARVVRGVMRAIPAAQVDRHMLEQHFRWGTLSSKCTIEVHDGDVTYLLKSNSRGTLSVVTVLRGPRRKPKRRTARSPQPRRLRPGPQLKRRRGYREQLEEDLDEGPG